MAKRKSTRQKEGSWPPPMQEQTSPNPNQRQSGLFPGIQPILFPPAEFPFDPDWNADDHHPGWREAPIMPWPGAEPGWWNPDLPGGLPWQDQPDPAPPREIKPDPAPGDDPIPEQWVASTGSRVPRNKTKGPKKGSRGKSSRSGKSARGKSKGK